MIWLLKPTYSGGRPPSRAVGRSRADLIHVVDLNSAVDGEPKNLPQIEAVIYGDRECEGAVGGGIGTIETVRKYLQAGVARVVLWNGSSRIKEFLAPGLS